MDIQKNRRTEPELIEENSLLLSEIQRLKGELAKVTVSKNIEPIASTISDGLFILDKNGIRYVNSVLSNLIGYATDEILNSHLSTFIDPAQREMALQRWKDRLEGKEVPREYEINLLHKDGKTLIPVSLNAGTLTSSLETVTIGIIKDLSEKKEKDLQIQQQQNLLQFLLDYTPDSIYFKDLESKFILVNKATAQKLGFKDPKDLIGKSDKDIFSSEHSDIARADELALINEDVKTILKNEKETWVDGSVTHVSTVKVPLKDENQMIIGTLGITRDITDIKKSEQIEQTLYRISKAVHELDNTSDLYSEIHQAIKELMKADNFYIALHDEESNMISFPYFVDETESDPPDQPFGNGLTEYVIRKRTPQLIDGPLDLELRRMGETDLIGEEAKIWLGAPLNIGEKTIGAIVLQDYHDPETYGPDELRILNYVSEQIALAISRKNVENSLKAYSKELQELNASKDKFFSILAHDLKSPFQGILGISRLLNEEFDQISTDEVQNFLKALNESAENTYSLIENLLDWSRLQTGRVKFSPTDLNLFEQVEKVKMLLFQTAELKKIRIHNFVDPSTTLYADPFMIQSLIQNIISNAIKFTPQNGKIKIKSTEDDKFVSVVIEDSGIGMEQKNIDKLFKIDVTYSTRGTEQEKGTGLGLMLCKEMVNIHGGEISVESAVNAGTKVKFTISKEISN